MEHPPFETLKECPLCQGTAFAPLVVPVDHTVSKMRFPVLMCATCGHAITNPRPTRSEIGRYYDSPDYISHTNTSRSLQDRLYQWVRRRAIRDKHRLIARTHSRGRVLDVGCGTGEFLGFLSSQGYQVSGVEPGPEARQQAKANHGIDAAVDIDAIPALAQFDVITLWHVLEHVHDVRQTLDQVHARSATHGLLLIAVPNRQSADAKHYGADWAAWDVPRHLTHFDQPHLERLLHEHGFALEHTLPMWFDAPYVAMLSERNRGRGPVAALILGALWGAASNLKALCTDRPTSSTLFVARKA